MQQAEREAASRPAPERAVSTAPAPPRLWSPTFVLICTVSFGCYLHWCLLTPILPLWVQAHGGSAALVGAIAFAFSLTSFVLRPFIGRAVDSWSARGVLAVSTLVLGLSGFGYLVYHVALLLAVRAVHGIGWAGYNTAVNVLLARVAPARRRGEAVGYMATAQGVAVAIVPALALWLLAWIGFTGLFLLSAAAGLLAALAVLLMPRQPRPAAPPPGGSFWQGLIERTALYPSLLHFLTMLPHSPTVTFVPLYATFRGIAIEVLPVYFLGYGVSTVTTRVLFGRWSDRVGRGWALVVGTAISAAALLLLALAADVVALTIGGVLAGFAGAANSCAGLALAIDRSREERRGAAMATYSMAFQLADGGGALLFGLLIGALGYQAMYLIALLAPVATLLLLARNWRETNGAAPARRA